MEGAERPSVWTEEMEGEERAERRTCRPTSPVAPRRRTVREDEEDLVAIEVLEIDMRLKNWM